MTATASSSSSNRISRQWSDLSYDLLVSIFSRLSSADLIVGVSTVCSSWRAAARNPHFWRVLDLSDWNSVIARVPVCVPFSQIFISVLWFVREYECIEEVYFPPVADEHDLFLVSQRLPNLFYINFPSSKSPGSVGYYAFSNFKSLKRIAVDKYFFQESEMFSLLGTPQIPDLCELKLFGNIPRGFWFMVDRAKRICEEYPKLRKLELPPRLKISTCAIQMLLDSLEHLEYLDISGCEILGFDKRVIDKATSRLKVFIWHGMKS
ncbi:hypothetical protein LUZ60_001417 [Juncus effusus]|nr:hypothetical protein LUZ60_001417 [Juncus effusus]